MSRRYTVAAARSRIADLLDEVERGETVVIERRGLRFEIVARGERKRPRRRAVMIEYIDPAILGADWTWEWKPGQLRFKTRQRT